MSERFEHNRKREESAGDQIARGLSNEAHVLLHGVGGSLGKIDDAFNQALDNKGEWGLKMGAAAVTGAVLGTIGRPIGIAGFALRAVGASALVSIASDALLPTVDAMGKAWGVRSDRELDSISDKLSTHLGRMHFDLVTTLPLAAAGAGVGIGLRRSLASTVSLAPESAKVSSAVHTEPRMRPRSQTPNYQQLRESAQRSAPREQRTRIVEGEIINDPKPRSNFRPRKSEPEIIDAEFTVISETTIVPGRMNHLRVNGNFEPKRLPANLSSELTMVQREDVGAFSVFGKTSDHRAGLQTALSRLQSIEAGWTYSGGALNSPLHTRIAADQLGLLLRQSMPPKLNLTPEAQAKLIKSTYGRDYEDPTGRMINIRV